MVGADVDGAGDDGVALGVSEVGVPEEGAEGAGAAVLESLLESQPASNVRATAAAVAYVKIFRVTRQRYLAAASLGAVEALMLADG